LKLPFFEVFLPPKNFLLAGRQAITFPLFLAFTNKNANYLKFNFSKNEMGFSSA
jgi:hypothetical protein